MSLINHGDLAESRLATQFKESTNLINYIRTLLKGSDELDQVFNNLLNNRSIDTAVGEQLNIIGKIVGIPRPLVLASGFTFFGFAGVVGVNVGSFGDINDPSVGGIFRGEGSNETGNTLLDDTQYRAVIKTKIIKNSASGIMEDIVSASKALLNIDHVYTLEIINSTENEIQLSFDRELNSNEILLLTELDLLSDVVGVKLSYIPNAWRLVNSVYNNVFKDISAELADSRGISFSPDGLKMFVTGTVTVYEYNLTNAWDVSTAFYSSNSLNLSVQDTVNLGLYFKNDGLTFFTVGSVNDSIYEYSLTTAWDITTASYSGNSFSVSTETGIPTGISFNPNGLEMFVTDNGTKIFKYDLATAWDITTASYSGDSFTVINGISDIYFRNDGFKMFVCNQNTDTIYHYKLTTAWDITTASLLDSFDISAQETTVQGLFFKNNGTEFYTVSSSSGSVFQFSTS